MASSSRGRSTILDVDGDGNTRVATVRVPVYLNLPSVDLIDIYDPLGLPEVHEGTYNGVFSYRPRENAHHRVFVPVRFMPVKFVERRIRIPIRHRAFPAFQSTWRYSDGWQLTNHNVGRKHIEREENVRRRDDYKPHRTGDDSRAGAFTSIGVKEPHYRDALIAALSTGDAGHAADSMLASRFLSEIR